MWGDTVGRCGETRWARTGETRWARSGCDAATPRSNQTDREEDERTDDGRAAHHVDVRPCRGEVTSASALGMVNHWGIAGIAGNGARHYGADSGRAIIARPGSLLLEAAVEPVFHALGELALVSRGTSVATLA